MEQDIDCNIILFKKKFPQSIFIIEGLLTFMTFDSNEFKTRANNFNSRLITMVLVENPKQDCSQWNKKYLQQFYADATLSK